MERNLRGLFGALKPQRTLLLFEPGEDTCEPVQRPEIPTSAFVSPNRTRYKEFVKRGAGELYDPVWDRDEILDVLQVIRSESSFPDGVQSLYTESAVEERYNEFGGILRYCLPQRSQVLRSARRERRMALRGPSKRSLIQYETIEHPDVSHHLAQFKVEVTGSEPFENATIDLVNDTVKYELWRAWLSVSIQDKIRALMRNDDTDYMDKACQDSYEDVVAQNLLEKMSWRQRLVSGGPEDGKQEESFLGGSCSRRIDGAVPKFREIWRKTYWVLYVANATRQSSGTKRVIGVEAFVNESDVPSDCKGPVAEMGFVQLTVMMLEMPNDYSHRSTVQADLGIEEIKGQPASDIHSSTSPVEASLKELWSTRARF
ncbi:hypothetical protein FGB62_6g45 [Gracilaria domingensis]|nr:hypothetical protein FGB62_6g45 [Gracilaria domingensis]